MTTQQPGALQPLQQGRQALRGFRMPNAWVVVAVAGREHQAGAGRPCPDRLLHQPSASAGSLRSTGLHSTGLHSTAAKTTECHRGPPNGGSVAIEGVSPS